MNEFHGPRRVTAATAVALTCAAALTLPSGALAAGVSSGPTDQTVAGAAVDSIGLTVATPVGALAPIQPGATAAATGIVTVTSTSTGNWTLDVNDLNQAAATTGHPQAAGTGCTTSASQLPTLGVTATGTGVTSDGLIPLAAAPTAIASGPSGAPSLVNTAFSDVIPPSTALESGCLYSLTAVFTASAA